MKRDYQVSKIASALRQDSAKEPVSLADAIACILAAGGTVVFGDKTNKAMKQATVKYKSPFFKEPQERPLLGYHWLSANYMRLTKPAKNDLMGVRIINTDGSLGAIFACDILNFDELPENLQP